MYQVDSDVFQSAKETELMSWKKNQFFEEVPYIGQKNNIPQMGVYLKKY